ncbi:MAG TPA: YMGG-like glycine zipper-containing protein [Sulfurovum sp.]
MKVFHMKNILAVGTVALMLTGCAQVGPQTQKGALVGAGTGAVVGAVSGGSVLKSAAVGTAIGAGVGYMQDTN